MVDGWDLVLVGVVLVGYAVVSGRSRGTPITSAMVFGVVGLLLGNEVLDVIHVEIGSRELRLLAEITLALVLFADASSLDSERLRRQTAVPLRLLGIALPLAIVLGTVVALPLFAELGVWEAVVLAVLLAPTDAALGQTVVSDRRLPTMVRQGLNVESGLNDGVCVPILVAAVTFAELDELPGFQGDLVLDLIKEVAIAIAVGAVVAAVIAWLVNASNARGWMTDHWSRLVPVGCILIVYPATAELHGSGFIAAFVAGLVYGRLLGDTAVDSVSLDEQLGQLLSAVTFLFFGAVMVGKSFRVIDVETIVYALLSLTFVRMAAVAISLIGSHATGRTIAFVGWFGPRGLATIVFTLTIVEESGLSGTERITNVATVTVALSVLLHGLTAPWLTDRYARWLSDHRDRLTTAGEQIEAPPSEAAPARP